MNQEKLFDHRAAVLEKYVYASAVTGYSHIMYCLPRQYLISPPPFNASSLRKHLAVVKVLRRPKIANEHAALLSIRKATDPDSDVAGVAKNHFPNFLDIYDPTSGSGLSLTSITLPAILPSITLSASRTEDPIPFVYHVFISLSTALLFLHNTCGCEYGDMHDGNVMLRLAVCRYKYSSICGSCVWCFVLCSLHHGVSSCFSAPSVMRGAVTSHPFLKTWTVSGNADAKI